PAPAYLRAGGGAQGDDGAVFSAALVQALERLPQLQRVQALRTSSVRLSASLPPLAVLARPLDAQPERKLPLVQPAVPVPAGRVALYVSEAVVDLYDVRPGQDWPAFSESFRPQTQSHQAQVASFFIAGVWRDY